MMKKVLFLSLMAAVLFTGCLSWGDIKMSADGCAVWNVALPDKATEAGVRNVIVTACAPTIAEYIAEIERQVGEFVSIDDVMKCTKEGCPEVAKKMAEAIKHRVLNNGDTAVKELLSK